MSVFHDYWLLGIVIPAGMLLSILFKKLTVAAAFTGGLLSICIFMGSGYWGIAMMTVFFLTGVIVTSWKLDIKQRNGLAEINKGRRTAGQVFANAGLPAIIGIIAWRCPACKIDAALIIAACFASATTDTVSSELGNVYGSRYYNILTLKRSVRGLNGVVSAEGILLGIGGSLLIALVYSVAFGWSFNSGIIIIAGTAGNFADSVLGASLERKNYLNNDAVNFLNTCIAALTAFLL